MSPTSIQITNGLVDITAVEQTSIVLSYSYRAEQVSEPESEEEKIKQIASEKMYASWKLSNLMAPKIQKVKQHYKPRHRIHNISRSRY